MKTEINIISFLVPVYSNRAGLGLHPANEKCRYKVTSSLTGCVQTYHQPYKQIVNGRKVDTHPSCKYMLGYFKLIQQFDIKVTS